MLDPRAFAARPFTVATMRRLLRQFSSDKGISPAAKKRGDIPPFMRGEFDRFASRAVESMIGDLPAFTTYSDFLSRQPAAFQDEALGPTRGKLFRAGGLSLEKFVAPDGQPFTLADLAKRHARAFRAAGLSPAAFAA